MQNYKHMDIVNAHAEEIQITAESRSAITSHFRCTAMTGNKDIK